MSDGLRQREAVTALERGLAALGRGDGDAVRKAATRVRDNDVRATYSDVVQVLFEIATLLESVGGTDFTESLDRLKELLRGSPYAPLVDEAEHKLTAS